MKTYQKPVIESLRAYRFETVCASSGVGVCLIDTGRQHVAPGNKDCQTCMVNHACISPGLKNNEAVKAIKDYLNAGNKCPGGLTLNG